ncbi:8-amino-7-oxononanoate synthase [Idiomarina sp. HP20-50]|uniref:aminotransferase class I/II-fold pyridoxal phosphate-dependent enzyme n=1 Tax=Idiomarina sp. HP20-50 TaxID=3070813 RepID=UPI00294AC1F4|nr:8-amino-7-oxononanoate synthase [Idiomarina sp. HP20-50]MDV6315079.1 8-amino-7-oxononanoate synthase [Idiomarina sp. HP20-50]
MVSGSERRLKERRSSSLFRTRKVRWSDSQWQLNFSTNDYLGLSQHRSVSQAFKQAIDSWGVGSTGSPLLSGYSALHQELEELLASWLGKPRALLFNSGFAANHGVLTTLIDEEQKLFADKLVHASIIDGMQHGKGRFKRYPHNQPLPIVSNAEAGDWLVTEGVFSMDGDASDLKQLASLKQQHGINIMLDDAHGLGAYGSEGRGSLTDDAEVADVITGTFGKALGVGGAFVCADNDEIESLIQFCRDYIYSTSMPPAQAAAIKASIEIVRGAEGDERRDRLHGVIQYFRDQMKRRRLKTIESNTAIQTWLFDSDDKALNMSKELRDNGYLCSVIRPPTVPLGSSRIRFSLTSEMSLGALETFWQVVDRVRENV